MPLNYLENELRGRARALISEGRLPCGQPTRMWGGNGTGEQTCSLCERVITRDEVEYEIEHNPGENARLTRFHFLCHAAWQLECVRETSSKKSCS